MLPPKPGGGGGGEKKFIGKGGTNEAGGSGTWEVPEVPPGGICAEPFFSSGEQWFIISLNSVTRRFQ